MVNLLPDQERPNVETPETLDSESLSAPEKITVPETLPTEKQAEIQKSQVTTPVSPPKQETPKKSKRLKGIEDILSADLGEAYNKLDKDQKKAFKDKGEEIALNVNEMIKKGKFKVKKVWQWIRAWLKMIPGVNQFFLEQQTKIKVDKLMNYSKEDIE